MKNPLSLLGWMQGDGRKAALFSALASAAILAIAYYFQYVVKLVPCELCYMGRKPHMVIIALGVLAFFIKSPTLRGVVLGLMAVAAIEGINISAFHVGVEHKWWQGFTGCSTPTEVTRTIEQVRELIFNKRVAACDKPAWVFAGLSMAGWNGVFYIGLLGWLGFALRRTCKSI